MKETTDFGLAVTLLNAGYYLEHIKNNNGNCIFIFRSKKDLDKVAQDYWNGKLLVDPKTFLNEIKNLKTRMYSVI